MSLTADVSFIEDHTVCFSWLQYNSGDNYLYLSNSPQQLKRKKYPDNKHIHIISFFSLSKDFQKTLLNLCLDCTLEEAKDKYLHKLKIREEPADWYVIVHINFEEGDSLKVCLESIHDFQYYDGYMCTDNCMRKDEKKEETKDEKKEEKN